MKTIWHSSRSIFRNNISSSLREWLFDPSSTTARFRKISCNLRINILQQGWLRPFQEESFILNLPQRRLAFIREVEIYCDDIPCIIGRTVIPETTFVGKNRRLLFELDERPIGELLFRDPKLQRSEFKFSVLKPDQNEYQKVKKFCDDVNQTIWARRSFFILSGKPILLTETFLPILKTDDKGQEIENTGLW